MLLLNLSLFCSIFDLSQFLGENMQFYKLGPTVGLSKTYIFSIFKIISYMAISTCMIIMMQHLKCS